MAVDKYCDLCGEPIVGLGHLTLDEDLLCDDCVEEVPVEDLESEDAGYSYEDYE